MFQKKQTNKIYDIVQCENLTALNKMRGTRGNFILVLGKIWKVGNAKRKHFTKSKPWGCKGGQEVGPFKEAGEPRQKGRWAQEEVKEHSRMQRGGTHRGVRALLSGHAHLGGGKVSPSAHTLASFCLFIGSPLKLPHFRGHPASPPLMSTPSHCFSDVISSRIIPHT